MNLVKNKDITDYIFVDGIDDGGIACVPTNRLAKIVAELFTPIEKMGRAGVLMVIGPEAHALFRRFLFCGDSRIAYEGTMKEFLHTRIVGHVFTADIYLSPKADGIYLFSFDELDKAKEKFPTIMNMVPEQTKKNAAGLVVINIAKDFTVSPGGAKASDGFYSGESFRKTFLEHHFVDPKADYPIFINLNGAHGYATGFLREAFGVLAKDHGLDRCLNRLTFICDDEPLIVEEIDKLMKEEHICDLPASKKFGAITEMYKGLARERG